MKTTTHYKGADIHAGTAKGNFVKFKRNFKNSPNNIKNSNHLDFNEFNQTKVKANLITENDFLLIG